MPLHDVWPRHVRRFRLTLAGICIIAILAWFGIPGAAVLADSLVVLGTPAIAAYLVWRGRLGAQAARVAAPSALVLSAVVFASAIATLNNVGDSWATSAAGGFAAAGALLLALAVAAGEGIAVLPFQSVAAHPQIDQAPSPREAPSAGGFTSSALQAIGASHQGVFELDFESEIVKLSREAAILIGLPQSKRPRRPCRLARAHPSRRPRDLCSGARRLPQPSRHRLPRRIPRPQRKRPLRLARTARHHAGRARPGERCLGLMADVTTRKETEAELVQRTLRDPLTGLGNRVALMEELEQLGARLSHATFALLDIDRFKQIHASLGDAGADGLLAQIADRVVKRFHGVAEVFRVGGDAFAVLFADAPGEPASIGHELLESCGAPYARDGRNVFAPRQHRRGAGARCARSARPAENAELALLQAKRAGGTCVRIYSRDLEELAPGDAVALETDLRRAVEDNQLDLYYQPIVRLADNTVAGFEALLRWNHPTRGLVSPADFIAHSEETGTIVALGRFALERAAHEMTHWQRYFPIDPPLFVSVNVSRRQLRDEDFAVFLGALLHNGTIAPGTLKLEVTESTVAANQDVRVALERCRALGAGLSIDDFGTGVSSLSQLKTLPFDTIKIDQSFLARQASADATADGETILKSIITLAQGLKRDVVVEGVETARDAQWLKALGCEFGQGFYFSHPLPSAQALQFIALHFGGQARDAAS